MLIRERSDDDAPWMRALLHQRWNGTIMYVHGEAIDVMALPALVAGENKGLATYRIMDGEAELVSLDAVDPGQGVGTSLLTALIDRLARQGLRRLWATTSNDNLAALAFYQRRGFRLQRVRAGAIDETRRLKPGIPLIAENGIPIRDEIDLCLEL
jgi:ribosomal protein S18 acetylase RimI-like enzyme